ncbi:MULTISPECIES: EAL and GGDEF domain-containing protein [Bacillaceae]|uniref:EAL domain-containing protein n=1 Tax=Evansella alkalicola TaxID=745819 RepID=A0ABS6K268_9BACI|nr:MULTISPECIES: bifunctional diguanylate cyclase/phosphodiesterase [Bacillaceae]MBU9723705.1 EAL domain-containing protein [Bacillus alkalicola]
MKHIYFNNSQLDPNTYPYKELLENFTEAIYVINLEGLFIDCNNGFSSLVGPREKYLNTDFLNIVHPEDLDIAKRGFLETLEGKILNEEHLRIFSHDGKVKSIITSKVPLHNKSGELIGVLGIAKDLTKEIDLYNEIQQQYSRYKKLLKNSSSVSCIVSETGEVLYRSPSIKMVLGYQPEQIPSPFFELVHPDEIDFIKNHFNHLLANPNDRVELDVRLLHKNGSWRTVHATCNNLLDDPDIQGITINYHDVTEMRQAQQKIHHMAYHDHLTGLPNRRFFEEKLEKVLIEAKARKDGKTKVEDKVQTDVPLNHHFGILFIDIDRFQFINETLGYVVGDKILVELAQIIASIVTKDEFVARMGSDEFMILTTNRESRTHAKRLATNILQRLESPIIVDHYELYVTGSIGITTYPGSGEDHTVLLKNSDLAMTTAKQKKENSYKFFNPAMEKTSTDFFALQNDLRKAIQNDEFELYYQPKVSPQSGEVIGAEALIRWNHPTRGIVPPGEFIPLAEDVGLIVPIGKWVFQTVCKQIKAWENKGFTPFIVSLNFSALQMLQKGLVSTISRILKENQVEGKWIEIEITESLILDHDSDVIKKLDRLSSLGLQIAIDDFGTGYSSLSYLRKFKFNTIKLDKSFINDIHISPENQAIIEFIIQMSNQLNMKVVAEGVEVEEQHEILKTLNCDALQGYLFSKPKPVHEFEKLLK